MTTKEYLSQVDKLKRLIQDKVSEIAELQELACSIGGLRNEEKVQTTPNHDPIGTKCAEIDELEREYKHLIGRYSKLKEEIKLQIVSVDNQMHRNVLFAKYVEGKSLERIADEMSRTYKHITKVHGKALMEFEKKHKDYYINIADLNEMLEKCD